MKICSETLKACFLKLLFEKFDFDEYKFCSKCENYLDLTKVIKENFTWFTIYLSA